jgi:spore maturation protein CgeB
VKLVVLGLSLSSSWGNGHATTYRSLLRAFAARGHEVTFLEREVPWYAGPHRDLADPDFCRLAFYSDLRDLERWRGELEAADAVIVGSYVPDGVAVGRWAQRAATGTVVFYDIDTPVTLAKLRGGDHGYLAPELIPDYDLYLSFTGGPTLGHLERAWGAPAARALYCSVDAETYRPVTTSRTWDLSYLGTYSPDRQPGLETLLLDVARQAPDMRFAVAGAQYPPGIHWPANVERLEHVPPSAHAAFYSASGFTLNLTRREMAAAGFSPSVRLFEAAACGSPIISDDWEGLATLFAPGREIVLAASAEAVLAALQMPASHARAIADGARRRILAEHTSAHRAAELDRHLDEARNARASRAGLLNLGGNQLRGSAV